MRDRQVFVGEEPSGPPPEPEGPAVEELPCLLAHYANSYLRRKRQRKATLQRWHDSGDAERLAKAFSSDVKDLGFLTPDCVLLEIDSACRLRRCSQGRLLNDPAAPEAPRQAFRKAMRSLKSLRISLWPWISIEFLRSGTC